MICPPDQLDYQIARHLSMHRRQWPDANLEVVRGSICRMLMAGQAWLWPVVPAQMELFAAMEGAG